MEINRLEENGKVTFQLDGWLDTAAAPELGKAVDSLTSASEIVLDFEKVEYIASSGLRQVVACYKKAKEFGAAYKLVNVRPEVMNIFKMTGLDNKIKIEG